MKLFMIQQEQKGDVIVVDLDFENGEPVKVAIDVRQEDGSMKKTSSCRWKIRYERRRRTPLGENKLNY